MLISSKVDCPHTSETGTPDGQHWKCDGCGHLRLKRLYHFTCQHSRRDIGTFGLLIPQLCHPTLGCRVTWLTSEATPDRESTGLGNNTGLAPCNRMEFRYIVDDLTRCRAWLESPERAAAAPRVVEDLESYGDPQHWWIASEPVKTRLDRSW